MERLEQLHTDGICYSICMFCFCNLSKILLFAQGIQLQNALFFFITVFVRSTIFTSMLNILCKTHTFTQLKDGWPKIFASIILFLFLTYIEIPQKLYILGTCKQVIQLYHKRIGELEVQKYDLEKEVEFRDFQVEWAL